MSTNPSILYHPLRNHIYRLKLAAVSFAHDGGALGLLVLLGLGNPRRDTRLSRTAPVLLFLTTPYVRPHGLGGLLANHLPRRACIVMAIFTLHLPVEGRPPAIAEMMPRNTIY